MYALRRMFFMVLITMIGNQMAFAEKLEGDALRENVVERLPQLNHTKLEALMERVGKKTPKNFYNCLCQQDRGNAAIGVGVSYHPEPLKPYSDEYECNRPGPPCMAQGLGCWRFPLPSDAKMWDYCIERHKYDDNTTIVDAIIGEIEVLHVEQKNAQEEKELDDYCKKFNKKPSTGLLKDVTQEQRIYRFSKETIQKLDKAIGAVDIDRLIKKLDSFLKEHPDFKPDEVDLRIDLGGDGGGGEIAFGFDNEGDIVIKELVGKLPNGVEIGLGLDYTHKPGDIKKVKWNGKAKFGFALEKGAGGVQAETKYGIEVDTNKNAEDYYDGVWAKESENSVIRFIENYISKFDFYGGGALGYGNEKMNVGFESSWNLRQRYTNLLFSDMNKALDNLLENQKEWEKKRRTIIADEAKRFNIDTRCLTSGQIQNRIWKEWEKEKIINPEVVRPFSNQNISKIVK